MVVLLRLAVRRTRDYRATVLARLIPCCRRVNRGVLYVTHASKSRAMCKFPGDVKLCGPRHVCLRFAGIVPVCRLIGGDSHACLDNDLPRARYLAPRRLLDARRARLERGPESAA